MEYEHREHIPAKRFVPTMSYCSDIYGRCPVLAPIRICTRLVDALLYNGKAIPGADDLVFATAQYRVMKIYLTVRRRLVKFLVIPAGRRAHCSF